jgi:hypothetical protein
LARISNSENLFAASAPVVDMTKKAAQEQPGRRNQKLQQTIENLGPWFQNIHLPDGAQTAPDHWLGDFPAFKWQGIASSVPLDLNGWTALDIGCNAGMEALLRSANLEPVSHPFEETYICRPAPGWRAMNRLLPTVRTEAPN